MGLKVTLTQVLVLLSFQYFTAIALSITNANRRILKMSHDKIVVTGLGVISPLGKTHTEFFDNICNGMSGISKVDRFDPTPFKCQIAGQVRDFDPKNYYNSKKKIKQNDLSCHYAVAASSMAMKDAGIELGTTKGAEITPGVDATRVTFFIINK
jgi:hypothetical protein